MRGKVSDRKARLFAVACCRRLELEIPDQRSWDAVHVAEWFADGNGTLEDLDAARRDAEASLPASCAAAVHVTMRDAWDGGLKTLDCIYYLGWEANEEGTESEGQVALIHEIFGNPFRTVTMDPRWRTSQVLAMAEHVYSERAYESMSPLAEALERAGCTNELLDHCRMPAPHVRGCWALDLILGKT